MMEMFWCCTTKEATTPVNIVKSTFQVFNIYAFGDTPTKKDYINAAIMNIFIWDLIQDDKLSPGSLCITSSECTLSLRLSEGSSGIVIAVLVSLCFHLWCPCYLHMSKSCTHSDLVLIHVGFVHSSPGSHRKKYHVYLLNYAVDLLSFEINGEADQFVTTHSQYHHRYPCYVLVLLTVHDFHPFYLRFHLMMASKLFIVACLSLSLPLEI